MCGRTELIFESLSGKKRYAYDVDWSSLWDMGKKRYNGIGNLNGHQDRPKQ